ncbi:hypothetical protein N824_22060 [Pedobacter sp. V48]|nr:hypothetical protein N824_22060 [Pedobacter sp. V48]
MKETIFEDEKPLCPMITDFFIVNLKKRTKNALGHF